LVLRPRTRRRPNPLLPRPPLPLQRRLQILN
jgi:hypothetical protein